MHSGTAKVIVASALAINCILWAQSRYGHTQSLHHSFPAAASRNRWNSDSVRNGTHFHSKRQSECAPLSFPAELQCDHVQDACSPEETVLNIPYLKDYFCTKPPIRPIKFGLLLFWLIFLFSFIGITASDFFCVNIGTIASVFGLSHNVAGVTFLAFGNGSPDLFSTFAAMRTSSGSLAIGELVGAASFIVSVVVGCMCIVKPFHVPRGPFLRDAGFFTASVCALVIFLSDEVITKWEAASLIGIYVTYAFIVIAGSWWAARQDRIQLREDLVRSEYRDDDDESPEPYRDDVNDRAQDLLAPPTGRLRSHSSPPERPSPGPAQIRMPSTTRIPLSRKSSYSTPYTPNLPSFSLLGALEFRSVVNALQREANSSALDTFDRPVSPISMRHSWLHGGARTPVIHESQEHDPWDTVLGMPLDDRPLAHMSRSVVTDMSRRPLPSPIISISPAPDSPTSDLSPTVSPSAFSIPLPAHTPETLTEMPLKTRQEQAFETFAEVLTILFPTLQSLQKKSILGRITSIVAAPAVFLLTVTVPVILTEQQEDAYPTPRPSEDRRLLDVEQEGLYQVLESEAEIHKDIESIEFNQWLAATQCVLGPLLCTAVLFGTSSHALYWYLGAAVLGVSAATLLVCFSKNGQDMPTRVSLCLMGFCVAMVWIMAIADEVVRVLQTFGLIFGLSDAIIGLTVFAVGNSLADLVANVTVAVFAPIMGFAACFGSPMLNMLLGIGISGSVVIHQTGHSYPLDFSRTLLVSCIGLLFLLVATLIFVPLNGYLLSKRFGVGLIISYVIIMTINIIVEVRGESFM